MSRQALKRMIQKFVETRDLNVMRGRGRKRISNETVEVAFDVVKRESGSQYSPTSARAVLRDLSLPWSTVRKILRSSLKWYPFKISFVQPLNPTDSEKCLNFVTNILARIFVNNEWPWNILWSDEAHFTLDGAVNSKN